MKLINGGQHKDDRGILYYFNDFEMSSIRRFYRIDHSNTEIIRAWQGHKKEQKWLYCTHGSFEVWLVKVDDWNDPDLISNVEYYILEANKPMILHIPGGFVNGLRAIEAGSSLLVLSNKTVRESRDDDYRFPYVQGFPFNKKE